MEQLIARCAGVDVGKKTVAATVRVPGTGKRREKQTRTFATTTRAILELRDWLAEHAVTVVGMESTGAYWKPIYYLLEDDVECWLLNAPAPAQRPRPQDRCQRTPTGSPSSSSTAWCVPA